MAFFLRVIKRHRWHKDPEATWIPAGDIPADPLADLMPKETANTISVWHIDENRSNLDRVTAAIAAGRDRISQFDYALFPQELVSYSGITISETPGDTADIEVNGQWHRHLVKLTANQVVQLAKEMYAKAQTNRRAHSEIRALLEQGIQRTQIRRERLKESLISDVG